MLRYKVIFPRHFYTLTIYYIGAKLSIYLKGEGFYHFSLTLFLLSSLPYLFIPPVLSLPMLKRKRRPPSLKGILRNALHCSRRNIYISDKQFDLVSDADMQAFLAFDKTDEKQWKEDIWDCDNFSLQFAASAQRYFAQRNTNAAIGIIWTSKHAFNLSINHNFKVHLWEPQTDKEMFYITRARLVII